MKNYGVHKHGNSWAIRWIDQGGTRRCKSLGRVIGRRVDAGGTATRVDATNCMHELIALHAEKPAAAAITRQQTIESWGTKYLQMKAKVLDPETIRVKERAYRRLVEYFGLDRKIETITRLEATEFELSIDLSPATVAQQVKEVKNIFSEAKKLQLIVDHNFGHLNSTPPRTNSNDRREISIEEVQPVLDQLAKLLQHEARLVVGLCFFAGLRTAEATHVTWNEVDDVTRLLKIEPRNGKITTKQGLTRYVPIMPELYEMLVPGFTRPKQSIRTITRHVKAACEHVGMDKPFTLKQLRAARRMIWRSEHDSFTASTWVGHDEQTGATHYDKVMQSAIAKVTKKPTKECANGCN